MSYADMLDCCLDVLVRIVDVQRGMLQEMRDTRRETLAARAPAPSAVTLELEAERDRAANPHGDSCKPPRRSALEIEADLRYAGADAMIARGSNKTSQR